MKLIQDQMLARTTFGYRPNLLESRQTKYEQIISSHVVDLSLPEYILHSISDIQRTISNYDRILDTYLCDIFGTSGEHTKSLI